jgi:hypothetical protein
MAERKEKMIEKIKGWKFKGAKEKLNNHLTESFRDLAQTELGELDTAASFMYLYNRFGKPNLDHVDEYKILYEYRFLYKDLFVTIRASGHSHVLFGLLVRSSVIKPLQQTRTDYFINIGKRVLDKGIVYYPYLFYENKLPAKYRGFARKNSRAIEKALNEYWKTKTDGEMCELNKLWEIVEKSKDPKTKHEASSKIWDGYRKPFFAGLVDKFIAELSEYEYWQFYGGGHIYELSNFPEIEKQCKEFLNELKIASWIRDVPINIKGYESETNEIFYPEEENG